MVYETCHGLALPAPQSHILPISPWAHDVSDTLASTHPHPYQLTPCHPLGLS